MKKLLSLLLVLSLFQHSSFSQNTTTTLSAEQQEVLDVVMRLFDGMREGDSSKVQSVFRNDVELHTSFTNREGKPVLLKDDLQKLLTAVGTPHDAIWDELIWDTEIRIDGNLASVWTEYAFYAGEQFSHCGVDALMLNKDVNEWKIFHLTDTRKKEGCEIPELIKK